jgi:anthranilate/para-aminobenzoate synthase component II
VIRAFGPKPPLLGVCLGHQASARRRQVRALHLMHGKPSTVEHDGRGIFKNVNGPFRPPDTTRSSLPRKGAPS